MPTTSPCSIAVVLQGVGEALDVAQQLLVGDVALLALLAAPVEGDALAQAVLDVAVQAVVGGVELAVLEPLVERGVGVVEDLLEVREPVQRPRLLGPPAREVLGGLLVLGEIGDQRRRHEVLRRVEALLIEDVAQLLLEGRALAVRHVLSSLRLPP